MKNCRYGAWILGQETLIIEDPSSTGNPMCGALDIQNRRSD